jgi:GH35 family endo-1,4-beta-xylanase
MKTKYSFKRGIQGILAVLLLLSVSSAQAQLARCKGKYFGNIVQNSVRSDFNTYWNQSTAENGSKWGSIENTRGVYNFNSSDVGFNWAKNNNGIFKFHTLVWGAQTPGWVASASTATITTAIHDFIKACSTHYTPKGGLDMIDVLNEPVNTAMPGNMKAALTAGYRAEPANAHDLDNQYGWAIWCFQLARKYFPNSVLMINEYNVEMNWNNCRAPYIAMTNSIRNAPNLTDGRKNLIDGVGLQCHGIENLTAANFKACIDEIWTKTNLPIHISEFDQPASPNEAKQQAVYASLIPVAWEHPHVAGVTLWGYVQGTTWINGNGTAGPNGTDTGILYSPNYGSNPNGERPAMTWLKQYLAGRPSLSCCPAPAPFASCSNNAPTVAITAPANNADFTAPATITISANASDSDGTITNVQFYNGNTLLGSDATAPYSFTWSGVVAGTYTITARATDNGGATTTSAAITITVSGSVPQTPYGGTPALIPGIIEAENYDLGGQGVAFNETTPGNSGNAYRTDDVDVEVTGDISGGYNVGWIAEGEWLEYTVSVTETGNYDLHVRVASENSGTSLRIEMDGADISGSVAIPNTGAWQTYQTVTVPNIGLTAGQKVMRIVMETSWFNLNYVSFTTPDTTIPNVPPTVNITAPASNSNFNAPATITISANASDSDGTITNVQFYNGNTLLGSDATAPYTFTWSGVATGTYTITARATDNDGATTISSPVTVVVNTVSTADIIGVDCGQNNTTLTFSLNASHRANATSYNWWYTGSAGSTAAVAGTPYNATIQTGPHFSSGQVCVGVNMSAAPWYVQYCKTITKCSSARIGEADGTGNTEVSFTYPNPSSTVFSFVPQKDVAKLEVINKLGEVVYSNANIRQEARIIFGDDFTSGMYTMSVFYTNGSMETQKLIKIQ